MQIKLNKIRGVAQLASAPALGAGCRGFESLHSDQKIAENEGFRSIFGYFSAYNLHFSPYRQIFSV